MTLLTALFAGFIGFFLRQYAESRARKQRIKNLLSAIILEIETGIERCKTINEVAEKNLDPSVSQISFSASRVYTNLWDSIIDEFAINMSGTDELKNILQIYKIFDLVNFNMERVMHGDPSAWGNAAGFAKYYTQIEELHGKLTQSNIYKKNKYSFTMRLGFYELDGQFELRKKHKF